MSTDRVGMVVAATEERAASWRRMAAFLKDNPDIAKLTSAPSRNSFYAMANVDGCDDPVQTIADWSRRAADAGARVVERPEMDSTFGGVELYFGSAYLQVYARRDRVCREVTVGMVPDVRYRLTVPLEGLTGGDGGGAA